jgi:hypothetical protein
MSSRHRSTHANTEQDYYYQESKESVVAGFTGGEYFSL